MPPRVGYTKAKTFAADALENQCCTLEKIDDETRDNLGEVWVNTRNVEYIFRSRVSGDVGTETSTDAAVDACGIFIQQLKETHFSED
ncbi:hypothetical protein [Aurantiacibacter xanthus]|uniref:hypothetical protein n=1 Tax=Aurantiacibacter xanthus TaxID=1784712 RepID=UPI0011C22395|nr:hypothetical protein [Aurantiacibacter xanthus]